MKKKLIGYLCFKTGMTNILSMFTPRIKSPRETKEQRRPILACHCVTKLLPIMQLNINKYVDVLQDLGSLEVSMTYQPEEATIRVTVIQARGLPVHPITGQPGKYMNLFCY